MSKMSWDCCDTYKYIELNRKEKKNTVDKYVWWIIGIDGFLCYFNEQKFALHNEKSGKARKIMSFQESKIDSMISSFA